MPGTVFLSAGGTGGHLFPAQALAQELRSRGWRIHLATDHRAEKFLADFPTDGVHIVRSATFAGKGPVALAKTFSALAMGYLQSRRIISKIKPHVAVGFGGYPTVPPLVAAAHKGVPSILHEQNAVMGRANRFLASRVQAVATGFKLVNEEALNEAAIVVTGNPLRQVAHIAAEQAYLKPTATGPFNFLAFGGSQGARFFSQVVPAAVAQLEPELQNRMMLTLQSRPEDANAAREVLSKHHVDAQVEPFYKDLPRRIADAHLVMCRAGASSVSELALIGRPSILVPLPGALDDDQGANAAHLEEAGGGILVRQKDLSAERLADLLRDAMASPEKLAMQAESAKKAGKPDAAVRLADVVEAHI